MLQARVEMSLLLLFASFTSWINYCLINAGREERKSPPCSQIILAASFLSYQQRRAAQKNRQTPCAVVHLRTVFTHSAGTGDALGSRSVKWVCGPGGRRRTSFMCCEQMVKLYMPRREIGSLTSTEAGLQERPNLFYFKSRIIWNLTRRTRQQSRLTFWNDAWERRQTSRSRTL